MDLVGLFGGGKLQDMGNSQTSTSAPENGDTVARDCHPYLPGRHLERLCLCFHDTSPTSAPFATWTHPHLLDQVTHIGSVIHNRLLLG
jgi:hypothetical protein